MDLPLTDTEKKIQAAIKDHPQLHHIRPIIQGLKELSLHLSSTSQQDILAVAITTHLTGMLAAQKMSGMVKSELIDLLIDDLIDTVRNRAFLGETKLRTKQ